MQRYKASLGLGGTGKDLSDPNDPRHCIILSLTMDSEGRPPVTIDLSQKGAEATLKDKPFKIKEGAKFSMTAKFKVQHEILSGLHYVQIVKRKGIRVSKDQEMIGSYAPNTDQNPVYTKRCKSASPIYVQSELTRNSRRGRCTIRHASTRSLYRRQHIRRR
jgi:Rho GDP-dissociation inhibitor